jgi:MFS family permease
MVGRKFLFLTGFVVFASGSLLCGLAPSIGWLVFFRVVQGVGGALLGANSIAIMVTSIESSRRAHGVGLFTAAQAIGISAGPALGGVLLDLFGWQWIFWVAVPVAMMAAMLGWFTLPPARNPAGDERFDLPGALLLVPCLVAGILVLNQASVWRLASPAMLLSIAVALVFFVLFVRRERIAPSPLVNLRLFDKASLVTGMAGVVLSYTACSS